MGKFNCDPDALTTLRVVAAAVLAVAVSGCVTLPPFQPRPLAPAEQAAVRERVRGYAKTHCGTCHQASLPTARPAALAIFDLDAENWSATLTPARLTGGFPRRLYPRLDADARRQLQAFIESELAQRSRG